MDKFVQDKNAMSVIVGTILLLAITVVLFSGLMSYFLSMPSPNSQPNANLAGTMKEGTAIGIIEHTGGESWAIDDSTLIVSLGTIEETRINFTNGIPSHQSVQFRENNSDKRWNIGDIIEINCTSLFDSKYFLPYWQIEVILVHNPSKSIITSCILKKGIITFQPPQASFTHEPHDPKVNEWIEFNASRSFDPDGGNILNYEWDFGDGETGYGKIINKRYTAPGTYNITLIITDDEGDTAQASTGSDITKEEYIPPPIVVKENELPLIIYVSWDNSSRDGRIFFYLEAIDPDGDNENLTYTWDFDDGIVSSEQNPIHTYNNSGLYNVTIIVTDEDGGQNQTTITIHVPNIFPQAGFTYFPRNISILTTIYFDGGTPFSFDKDGSIVNWSWDFDANGIIDGYGSTVMHQYTISGNYTIILNVTDNDGGQDIELKTLYVSATPTASSPRFLIVDNTPTNSPPGVWPSGIDNVIAACQSIMPQSSFSYGKAIDQWTFTNDEFTSPDLWNANITSTLIDQFDIVLWSTGDFPGDGGNANYDGNANTWSTSMTEGSDDTSNHVYEIAEHLMGNKTAGTLLVFGTYAARDLQDYSGNGANDDEIWLGNILGLVEPTGGISYDDDTVPYSGRVSGSTGMGYSYFRGEPYYSYGVLQGITNTSTDKGIIASINITSPINLYALNKQDDDTFVYSLQSGSSQGGGILLDEDMDTNPGWIHGGYEDEWEYDVPIMGPSSAHSGSRVYGTDIDYYYNNNANCWLKTPSIDLTDCSVVTLEFYDWFNIIYNHHGTYDHVYLEITDDGGVFWDELDDFHGDQESWTYHSYDLSSYANNNIQIRWRLVSDNSWRSYGYYLDDVTISVITTSIPAGYYAIDANRGSNRTVILGFDLNANEITNASRSNYLRNVLAWLAEGACFMTEIWVDNNPPDGWLEDPQHVASIQEGIDAVSPGGKVFVNGSVGQVYHENVLITKSIDFVGINHPTIEIDGNFAIKTTVDWTKIDGFSITGDNLNIGIFLENVASTTIVNCTIFKTGKAICLDNAHNTTVCGNILRNSTYGIDATYSVGNTIKNNEIFSNSDFGVNLPSVDLTIIQENDIYYNGNGGIKLDSSRLNNLLNNSVHHNGGFGIHLAKVVQKNTIQGNWVYNNSRGLQLDTSNSNNIFYNMIFNNSDGGIYVNKSSHSNILEDNVLYGNNLGVAVYSSSSNYLINNSLYNNSFGIKLATATDNTFLYNVVYNVTYSGLCIFPNSDGNVILSNTFFNAGEGIFLEESKGNFISQNNISHNRGDGISLYQASSSTLGNNDISNNTIAHNEGRGAYVSASNGNRCCDNIICNNSLDGIYVVSSNENTFKNNTLINNSDGIYLKTSTLNYIEDNIFSFNRGDGIVLSLYCSYTEIRNNTIDKNSNGIFISRCYNSNIVSNNNISNNTMSGMFLEITESNEIRDNFVVLNGDSGIYFYEANVNIVQGNNVSFNSDCGMEIFASEFNIIIDNNFSENHNHGLTLVSSNQFTDGDSSVSGNYVSGNLGYGIYLLQSNGNILHNNTVKENLAGLCFSSSDENNIVNNVIFINNLAGIYLTDSSIFNTIENNTLWGNKDGIVVNHSDIPIIQFNELFWHNDSAGILIKSSTLGSSYPLSNNVVNDNSKGIQIVSSSGTHVKNNMICNNTIAVLIEYSNYVFVQDGNIIRFNTETGIHIKSSSNAIIEENFIGKNGFGVWINNSDDNLIRHNNIEGNTHGVYFNCEADDNIVKENNITLTSSNQYVVNISGGLCANNYIYWNNFRNETYVYTGLAIDNGGEGNCWYNPESEDKKGNYWGNYLNRYPDALPLPGGWWNTYYQIAGGTGRKDIRPLIDVVGWW